MVASRVLFTEPIWSPDVEAQAIKVMLQQRESVILQYLQRVHRTGQTRPVVVQTLAIRDTFEQEMLERRAAIQERSIKMPEMTDEAGLRSYIEVSPHIINEYQLMLL